MNSLFCGCSSLQKLPDISKWKANNVYDINSMFSNSSSLIELPDISNWNINNIKNMSYLFNGCFIINKIT